MYFPNQIVEPFQII